MRARAGALTGFTLLAGYASLHWFALVADPPLWRSAVCVGIALALAMALNALGRRPRGVAMALTGAALVIAALAAGLLAIGVPANLLPPGAWDELGREVDAGLAGISEVELPYDAEAEWTRRGILLGAPLALIAAAAIAFWPARRSSSFRRGLALAILVALYGVAVTWESPSAELAHGAGLFACIAACLWLGDLPAARLPAAAGALALAGLAALPAAARVDTRDPAINYTDWRLFGASRTAEFDWDHSYGPLDWPQRGTELFEVRGADRPLYWKTSVLDGFNGASWARGDGVSGVVVTDTTTSETGGVTEAVLARRPEWVESVDIEIGGLRSPLLVSTGTALDVDGVATRPSAPDGTTGLLSGELAQGAEYGVTAYSPDPSARLLRKRDDGRYPRELERYTTLLLPQGARLSTVRPEVAPIDPLVPVTAPLRGASARRSGLTAFPGVPVRDLIAGTPYARVRALALRLTRDAPGNYEAVARIERYLLGDFVYEQNVPERDHPLPAFLFRDRQGYCQQFSGAMALMLRLAGIPSRVVTGFAPGLPDRDTGAYVVRDTDAHSWVEVWFPRVGWVTVDPTPSAAPARTEFGLSPSGDTITAIQGRGRAFSIEETRSGAPRAPLVTTSSGDEGSPVGGIAGLVMALAGVASVLAYRRRRRRLLAPEGAEPQLRELQRALPLIGRTAGPRLTLLGIEQELATIGPGAARYAQGLRHNRYSRDRPRRPGPEQRRALRRALARGRGLRGRIRALRAIPPGGPAAG